MAVFRKLRPRTSEVIADYLVERWGGEKICDLFEGVRTFGVKDSTAKDIRCLEECCFYFCMMLMPEELKTRYIDCKELEEGFFVLLWD